MMTTTITTTKWWLRGFFLLLVLIYGETGAPPGPETVFNDAGYISVYHNKRHLFYWFFESRSNPATDPFVLWMSGGPGCSGQLAMFGENGPYLIQEDLSLKLNPYSWNNNATVLWIDQPAGTGYSYGSLVINEDEMANDMYEFFTKFFIKYPKYAKNPFYVFGESYGGHYVPAFGRKLARKNQNSSTKINFKGAAIGNGLTDPATQFLHYGEYAEKHHLLGKVALGMIKAMLPICEGFISECNRMTGQSKWQACLTAFTLCTSSAIGPVKLTGINLYDIREKCDPELPLCYNFTLIDQYLNQEHVQEALSTKGHHWGSCNKLVNMALVYAGDWMLNFSKHVQEILEDGYNVLIYAGEYDYICNWLGNQAWTNKLAWEGKKEFNEKILQDWVVHGIPAGLFKTAQGLSFLKFYDAGHMVPRDQPQRSLEMFNTFIFNQTFLLEEQNKLLKGKQLDDDDHLLALQ